MFTILPSRTVGNHRTIALAVATADANDLMLLVARSLLIGCSKSRHRGSAHCSGSGYSSCSFEKASARNAFDRYVQFRHFSSYLQMQRNLSALHSGAMHKRPPLARGRPLPALSAQYKPFVTLSQYIVTINLSLFSLFSDSSSFQTPGGKAHTHRQILYCR